jgi:hypothetical protein
MDIRGIGFEGRNWFALAQDRVSRTEFVDTIMKIRNRESRYLES